MSTYHELKAQAEKLMAQAEELRLKEINDAILDIRKKIDLFGLTAQDLGLGGAGRTASRKKSSSAGTKSTPAKYRGPNGESWSGGRGRKPQWVANVLAEGKKLEDFLI